MTPNSPASASPPRSSAPAFERSIQFPRTPALPPAPGRAKFDFAACDPYFPILRGPAFRITRNARAHPSGAAFLLLVRGLLDPCQIGAKAFILARAARLSLDSLQSLLILRPALFIRSQHAAPFPPKRCVLCVRGMP